MCTYNSCVSETRNKFNKLFYPLQPVEIPNFRICQDIFVTLGMRIERNCLKYLIIRRDSAVDRFSHKLCPF